MSILNTFINLPGTIVSGVTDVIFGNEAAKGNG